MFWHEKRLTSEEYEKTIKRIITLEADVDRLKRLSDNNSSAVSSLRGLVNRKLGGKDIPLEEEPAPLVDDGFNELRKLNKDKPA